MDFKRGDVVMLPDKSFAAVIGTGIQGVILACHGKEKPSQGEYFPVDKLKKIVHPQMTKCQKCSSSPFVGKHSQRAERKWRVYCLCDGPGSWEDTKGEAILNWNRNNA